MSLFDLFNIARPKVGALRTTVAVFGIYGGLLGLEHGFFETLHGNVATNGIRIRASLSELPFPFGHEPAVTIIPNFLVTGILTMIVALLIVVWATACVQKKGGGPVLFLLSIALFLVGGGFGPVTLLIAASIATAGINQPSPWWRSHLSAKLTHFLAESWLWCFIAALLWVPVEFVAGYIFAVKNDAHLNLVLCYPLLGFFALTLITGFSCEIARRIDLHEPA